MPSCCVPNCNTGYRNGSKGSLFSVPQNPELLEKWRRKIPRKDRLLQPRADNVCEKHFLPDQIIRNFQIKIGDKVESLPRDRPMLVKGAIPCIFPECPAYMTNIPKKRKSPKKRLPYVKPKSKKNSSLRLFNEESCDSIGEPNNENVSILASLETRNDENASVIPTFETKITEISSRLPPKWAFLYISDEDAAIFLNIGNGCSIEKKIIVFNEMINEPLEYKVKVFVRDIEIKVNLQSVRRIDDIPSFILLCDSLKPCENSSSNQKECLGIVVNNDRSTKCIQCREKMYYETKKEKRRILGSKLKIVRTKKKMNDRLNAIRRCGVLSKKVQSLKEIIKVQKKCSNTNTDILKRDIANLPPAQQENILACLNASKKFKGQGNRYTTAWVYHCLMLRIRSHAAYNHLRENKIMALPCPSTLNRYLRKMRPAYGFQMEIFNCMKRKAADMAIEERRGSLVIDEMKLTPNLRFDRKEMKIIGFTDLGDYTPINQADKEGDHALVLLFQPFQGSYIQAVAAFLSKGAASSAPLNHILIEAISLIERSGFYVDAIVTDGANWNRGVWKLNGVTNTNPSCVHVFDETRQLYFVSDLPHLIKSLRNWILKVKIFWTPDGIVYLEHWQTIVNMQQKEGIFFCPKLSQDHLEPKQFQKMSCSMAYQFFGQEIPATLMAISSNDQKLNGKDVTATCKFITRVHQLILAMNSRCPKGALRLKSKEYEVITTFIDYLKEWEKTATSNNYSFMTDNCYTGLVVTLQSTIQLYEYLNTNFHYLYFMTSRINQDCLEHFFGLVRQSGGNNDHPNPTLFICIFRLLCVYSLAKPPRGSNVPDSVLIKNLLTCDDMPLTSSNKEHWQFVLDRIIDNADAFENEDISIDSTQAMQVFSGYVAKRAKSFSSCNECIPTLITSKEEQLTYLRNRDHYNALTTPNSKLWALLQILEDVIQSQTHGGDNVSSSTFFDIAYKIEEDTHIILIGCDNREHQHRLTAKIINFYIITRMHLMCKFLNRKRKNVVVSRNTKKMAKLKT